MAPQGYINDKVGKTILPDPDRFDLIKKMWEMLLSGCYSPQKILDIATEEWGYRQLKGQKKLTLGGFYEILRNPFYTGKMLYKGDIAQGSHTPMITWDQFLKAQSIIGSTRKKKKDIFGIVQTERPSKKEFAFTGAILCGECGCMVTAEQKTKTLATTGKQVSYIYYRCTHKKDTSLLKKCAQKGCLPESVLDEQIAEILASLEIHPDFFAWAKEVLQRRYSEENQGRELIYKNVQDEIDNCNKKMKRLVDMKVAGEFEKTEDDYFARMKTAESELSALQIRRQELEKEQTDWNALIVDTFDFAKNALKAFKNGNIETRKIIFRSLGSNWTLKDKKLQANLNDWLLPLQKSQNSNSLISIRLEPDKKGISLRKTDALND